MPEGNTALAQAAIYLATAPKSNAVYRAYLDAAAAASQEVAEPVPLHLRNAPTRLMKDLEYGKGYRYAHDEPAGVADMDVPAAGPPGRRFYEPVDRGFEIDDPRTAQGAAVGLELHAPEHLVAQRKNEREPEVALHPADRDADELTFAVEHAAARDARDARRSGRSPACSACAGRRTRSRR